MHLSTVPILSLLSLLVTASPLPLTERGIDYPAHKTGNVAWWFPQQGNDCQMNAQNARDLLQNAADEARKHKSTDSLPVPEYKGDNRGVFLDLKQNQGDIMYGDLAKALDWLKGTSFLKSGPNYNYVRCLKGTVSAPGVSWTAVLES